jgi:hypothetical protein
MTTPMTTPMTIIEIERRLRFAAPDEPSVLPPLAFPTTSATFLRPTVRFRHEAQQRQGLRLAYAVVALLLLAAAITVGTLRLLETKRDPLADVCGGPAAPVPDGPDPCIELPVPVGWQQLGAGQLFPGDFTETGIAYEVVNLVIANAPVGACATPGGPPPEGVPVGSNIIEVPRATPDPGLACLRDADLPANGVRVVVMKGMRSSGVEGDGPAMLDNSEPTAEAGWTEQVGGRPARLTVAAGAGSGGPAEIRTWDVLMPRSVENIMRITADIAGPDLAAGRRAAQDFIDSIGFKLETPKLRDADANNVLRRVLDAADRGMRNGSHSDLFGCFPREPGNADGTISGGLSGPLAGGALAVTCTSAISPSLAGVWRIALAVTWQGTETYQGDTLRTELYSSGLPVPGIMYGDLDWTGGQFTSDAGQPMPDAGVDGLFPTARYVLPPLLAGPLNLAHGSIVQMLYPAEEVVASPGNGAPSDSIYPGFVGTHLYVIDGPEVIDGEEWYQVQSDSGGGNQVGWVRGTRGGRPQLEIVQPACPSGDMTPGDLAWITAAERLACFGDQEVSLGRSVLGRPNDVSLWECSDGSGNVGPCPVGLGKPDWLTLPSGWTLYDEAGPAGPMPGIAVWLHPGVSQPTAGELVRVRGHFDDAEAAGCVWPPNGSYGLEPQPPEIEELICRQRFVITAIEQP